MVEILFARLPVDLSTSITASGAISFPTSGITRMQIDTSGLVSIGGFAGLGFDGANPIFQVGSTSVSARMALLRASNDGGINNGTRFYFIKSKSVTIPGNGIIASGDQIGRIVFMGDDGAAFQNSSFIVGEVDGAVSAGAVPGRVAVWTAPAGSVIPVECLRIDSAGRIQNAGQVNIFGLFGTASQLQITNNGGDYFLGMYGTSGGTTSFQSNVTAGATATTNTLVAANAKLFGWDFGGNDGTGYKWAGAWAFEVDGTAASGSMPGRFRLFTTPSGTTTAIERLRVDNVGNFKITGGTLGYGTGVGGTVTQITSRTTTVVLNKICGQITMFSAAGSATAASFTVTDSTVAATDTIILNQQSGTNLYVFIVTAVAAGSFVITFFTTGGVAVDAPVINFSVLKAVTA